MQQLYRYLYRLASGHRGSSAVRRRPWLSRGFVVAEQVNVLSGPFDYAVCDEGVPAAEGKAVACGGAERDRCHLLM
jgi:hypothetical protein